MNESDGGLRAGVDAGGGAAAARREPTPRSYAAIALATLALTAAELLLALSGAPGGRILLVPLMLANFLAAAAFYQGLWFDPPVYRTVFGAGLFFGLLTCLSLVLLLGLGTVAQP
jgi:hypothetical protein